MWLERFQTKSLRDDKACDRATRASDPLAEEVTSRIAEGLVWPAHHGVDSCNLLRHKDYNAPFRFA